MKRPSSVLLLTLFSVITFLSSGIQTYAQSSDVQVSATIESPLSAETTSGLEFGALPKGAPAMIAASSPSAGGVSFSGDERDEITITLPATVTLQTDAGAGSAMVVALDRNNIRGNTSADQGTALTLNAGSGSASIALSNDLGGNGLSDGLGQVYLWIGGTVTPDPMQQRGMYSGTFTVTAAYSN